MLRQLVGGDTVTLSLNGEDNLVVDISGSSSSIPSTIATFLSSNITLTVPTICNLGLTVANTLIADEVHTDTIRTNYFISNGATEVTLLGTTEASIACAADTLGLAVVRARHRRSTQGCVVGTNTANADICLQNMSASRSIRLAGTTMSFGDVASPGMTVSDTGISLIKEVTTNGHLGI